MLESVTFLALSQPSNRGTWTVRSLFFPISKPIFTVDYYRSWSLNYVFSMYPNSTFPKLTSFGDCHNLSFLNYLLKFYVLMVQPVVSFALLWTRAALAFPAPRPSFIYRWWIYIHIPNKKLPTYKKNPNGSEIVIYKVCNKIYVNTFKTSVYRRTYSVLVRGNNEGLINLTTYKEKCVHGRKYQE